MKQRAVFYHAGCPVCVSAEQTVVAGLDPTRYDVEVVHLGTDKRRLSDAEKAGVTSVPALVLNGRPFHVPVTQPNVSHRLLGRCNRHFTP